MNVSDLIDPSFSYRLIATLMHFLWQGCLVALLAVVGDWLLSRASARRRYALHVTAMAIMVACVAITFSRIESPVSAPAVFVEPVEVTTVAEPIIPSRVDDDSMASTETPAFVGVEPSLPGSIPVVAVEPVESPIVHHKPPDEDHWRPLSARAGYIWAPQIALLYFVCCGLLLARLIRGTWVAHRLRRMATTVSDDSLIATLQRQAQELGLRVLPRIAWCAEVSIPLVIGVLKPMILLPAAAATGLSADQLQALITHELAHIRRYDLLVNMAQRVVESMLFFHPAVWFISRRISNEREQACDELVLATGCERLRYADALVRMAELSSSLRRLGTSAPATSLAAAGANSSEFKRRVLKVLSVPTTSHMRPSRIALLVIVALICGATISASRLRPNVFADTQPTNAADSSETQMPPVGLEFLKPYPKLHGLSFDMTEPQFLEIIKQQELQTRKTIAAKLGEGEQVAHQIALGDGHTLIVMFDKVAKCSGIRRVRGDDDEAARLEALQDKEKRAIAQSIDFLRQQQLADGRWPEVELSPGSITSLALCALLQAGVAANDPAIQKGLKALRTVEPNSVYVVSLQTMAFCLANPQGDAELIRRNVKWLQDAQNPVSGGWRYQLPPQGAGFATDKGDGSNSRFAVLALHQAAESGFEIPAQTWQRIRNYWIASRVKDGGWCYQPGMNSTPTMTCSGIASLAIVHRQLEPKDNEAAARDEAIRGGLAWLTNRFSPTLNSTWFFYHAHCLERAAHLNRVTRIGEHDWRPELVAEMLNRQQPDGSFAAHKTAESPLIATSLALMTLSGRPAADVPNTEKGLGFLKSYPQLHGLSLDMTEPQFLEIVKRQDLKTRKTVEGEKVTHHIALGDGHSLIVMFDKDAKCGGIQRVRNEALSGRLFVNAGVRTAKDETRISQSVIAIDPSTGKWTALPTLNKSGFTVPLSPVRVSPDGRTLLFMKKEELWKCDAITGEGAVRVLEKGSPAAWSPDGKTLIAVVPTSESDPQMIENWVVSIDGQKQSVLPLEKGDEVEDWSADGQWLAVKSRVSGQVLVVKPDGNGRRKLADSEGGFSMGRTSFAPDGKRVVYLSQQEADEKHRHSLRIINVDGTGDHELLGETKSEPKPSSETWTAPMSARWSPDGKHLAVVLFDHARDGGISAIGGNWRLAFIDPDGSNLRELKLEGMLTTVLPWDGPEWITAPPVPAQAGEAAVFPKTKAGEKLDPGVERRLKWGQQVNGLRAAMCIQSVTDADGERKPDVFMAIQNVSEAPIHLVASAEFPNPRNGLLSGRGLPQSRTIIDPPMPLDVLLQPRQVTLMHWIERAAPDSNRTDGRSFAQILIWVPVETLMGTMTIDKAPPGAWTGKLVTGDTSGTDAMVSLQPKGKEAQSLYQKWQTGSRANGNIPGGSLGPLARAMKTFIKHNSTHEAAPKFAELLKRFERERDWTQAEAVTMLDEVSAIYPSLLAWVEDENRFRLGGDVVAGQKLPEELKDAPWGAAQPSGLRVAWLLEPRRAEHRLNTPLKSRVVFHNSGKNTVVFRAQTWNQSSGHKAIDAQGKEIFINSTRWTTIPRTFVCRLAPGEFHEVIGAGIGVGKNNDNEDWRDARSDFRVGAWIEASAGDEVTFTPDTVDCEGRDSGVPEGEVGNTDPKSWWLRFIQNRLSLDAPLPTEQAERGRILERAVRDLFGNEPTEAELIAFKSDPTPGTLDALAKRLAERSGFETFSGPLTSGPTKFKVLPVDPDAAKKPRTAKGPGQYRLGGNVTFVVTRRPIGERVVNEAHLSFSPPDATMPAPRESHPVPLPDDYDTWFAAWMRGGTVLWVAQTGADKKDSIRRFDFTDPASVKETVITELKPSDTLPQAILDAVLPISARERPANPGDKKEEKQTGAAADRRLGAPAVVLPDHLNVMAVGFDRDGKELVSVATEHDVAVRVWDLAEKKLKREVKLETDKHGNFFLSGQLTLSGDRKRVLAILDGKVMIWDTATGKLVKTLELPEELQHGFLRGLSCTPDLSVVACGREPGFSGISPPDAHAIVWDVATGKMLRTVKHTNAVQVHSLALSPDGKLLATGGQQTGTCLWDVGTGTLLHQWPNNNPAPKNSPPDISDWGHYQILCLRFSPDGQRLALGDMLGVKMMDVKSGKLLFQSDAPFRFGRSGLVFSKDGQLLARTATDKVVPIWSATTGKLLAEVPTEAHDGCFSDDGRSFAVGFTDKKQAVAIWQLQGDGAKEDPQSKIRRGQDALDRAKQLNPAWGEAADGLQVGLARLGDKSRFRAGERVPLEVFVRNAGKESVVEFFKEEFFKNVPTVRDPNGKEVAIEPLNMLITRVSFKVTLQPGEVFAFPHWGLGIGATQPADYKRTAWHPFVATPITGTYTVEQSLPITIKQDGSDASRHVNLRSGLVKFDVEDDSRVMLDNPARPVARPGNAKQGATDAANKKGGELDHHDPHEHHGEQTLLKETWGPEHHGLRTRLIVAPNKQPLGWPFRATCEVKNVGSVVRKINPQGADYHRGLEVIGPDGKQCEFLHGPVSTLANDIEIKPGESRKLFEDIEISSLFLIPSAGEYTVRLNGGDKAKVGAIDDGRAPIPPPSDVKVTLKEGKLPPIQTLFLKLRPLAPKNWSVHLRGLAIHFTGPGPGKLAPVGTEPTAVQLWFAKTEFSEADEKAQAAQHPNEKVPQLTRLGMTPLGFGHLTATGPALKDWPQCVETIRKVVVVKEAVEVRLVGGPKAEPLSNVKVEFTTGHGGDLLSFGTFTTDEAGWLKATLPDGFYYLHLKSEKEWPYLPFEKYWTGSSGGHAKSPNVYVTDKKTDAATGSADSALRVEKWLGGYRRDNGFEPATNEHPARITFTLEPAVELILGAVDIETGKGIGGANFYEEVAAGEDWAHSVYGQNLGSKFAYDSNAEREPMSLTDNDGYLHRWVGDQGDETKFGVWKAPTGYELVEPKAEISIPTDFGQTRVEQVFKFRRIRWAVRLEPEKKKVTLGEPLTLTFFVKNATNEPRGLELGGDYRNRLGRPESFEVRVINNEAKPMPVPDAGPTKGGLSSNVLLKPDGETKVELKLSDWATISQPGNYRVFVKRTLKLFPIKSQQGDRIEWGDPPEVANVAAACEFDVIAPRAAVIDTNTEPNAEGEQSIPQPTTSPPVGLEFLKPYPKLHGLSLNMTEPQFLEIVKQQELKTRKSADGEKVTHHIALGDDHTLIVMFDKDAKCSGIQRVRGEDEVSARTKAVLGRESFKGRVVIVGPRPKLPQVTIRGPGGRDGSPGHVGKTVPDESVLISEEGGLANVAVYLRKAPAGWKPTEPPREPVDLKSEDDYFRPRMSLIRVGQSLRLHAPPKSSDSEDFAARPMKSGFFQFVVNPNDPRVLPRPFTEPERLPVKVESYFHIGRQAWLLPLDHPFAAVTDAEGRFAVRDLPQGEHEFVVWHERTGYLVKKLKVWADPDVTAEIALKFPASDLQEPEKKKPAASLRLISETGRLIDLSQTPLDAAALKALREERRKANDAAAAKKLVGTWKLKLPVKYEYTVEITQRADGCLEFARGTALRFNGVYAFSKNELALIEPGPSGTEDAVFTLRSDGRFRLAHEQDPSAGSLIGSTLQRVPEPRAGRGSPDPALAPTAGLPNSVEETKTANTANGDLRSNPAAGSGDPRRAQDLIQPQSKESRALFQQWQRSARANGNIPGGTLGPLVRVMRNFVKNNSTHEAAPKFTELLKRIEVTRDWSRDEAVKLLDEVAAIYPSLPEWVQGENRFKLGGDVVAGKPLPEELKNAPWGEAQPDGLRVAWLLEPRALKYRLGTPLKSRILFHNAGKNSVVFRALTWNQSGEHKASDAQGTEIHINSTYWTTMPMTFACRLAPGEFLEVVGAGIGVGANTDDEDWRDARRDFRVGSWIEAKAGDEVTFVPAAVHCDARDAGQVEGEEVATPENWWLKFISDRLSLDAPLPAAADERRRLLDRSVRDLFGNEPTPEEITAFTTDAAPDALNALAKRLANRAGFVPFSGSLKSGTRKFLVLPPDPDAAKKPRSAKGPGQYKLGGATFVVTRRPIGERVVNEAHFSFSQTDATKPARKSHPVPLPDGYDSWIAAWMRVGMESQPTGGGTVLWVAQKGADKKESIRRYDFTNPESVKETVISDLKPSDDLPQAVLDALSPISTR